MYDLGADRELPGGTIEQNALTIGVDAGLRWSGLSILGERLERRSDPEDSGVSTLREVGTYGQVGWFVIPQKLEIAGRYGIIGIDGGPNEDREEVAVAAQWSFNGDEHELGLEVGRQTLDPSGSRTEVETYLRIQWQLAF